MHNLTCPYSFLATNTIGAHHSVASVTGSIIPSATILSSSFFKVLCNGIGTLRGVLIANGEASDLSLIEYSSLNLPILF